jgi:hypothetical protein
MNWLSHITLVEAFHWLSGFVLACSVLASFFPPYEWFAPWPKFQRVYVVIQEIIGRWGAVNLKTLIYPSIMSTANASGTSNITASSMPSAPK